MRPTKFNQSIIEKSEHYLNNYKSEEYNQVIPSIVGLAVAINIRKSTIYKWIKEKGKEQFSDITERILSTQEMLLKNMGLSGKYNPAITKLLLSQHGIVEKNETALTGKDGKPLQIEKKIDFSEITDEQLDILLDIAECKKKK